MSSSSDRGPAVVFKDAFSGGRRTPIGAARQAGDGRRGDRRILLLLGRSPHSKLRNPSSLWSISFPPPLLIGFPFLSFKIAFGGGSAPDRGYCNTTTTSRSLPVNLVTLNPLIHHLLVLSRSGSPFFSFKILPLVVAHPDDYCSNSTTTSWDWVAMAQKKSGRSSPLWSVSRPVTNSMTDLISSTFLIVVPNNL